VVTFWRDARLPRRSSRTTALKQSERRFQDQVTQCARLKGWECYHPYDSRRSPAGWPDLALVRPPRIILVELKTDTGIVSPAQRKWLDLLVCCPGVETYVWRPHLWDGIVLLLT
jgi:hypothetical protein